MRIPDYSSYRASERYDQFERFHKDTGTNGVFTLFDTGEVGVRLPNTRGRGRFDKFGCSILKCIDKGFPKMLDMDGRPIAKAWLTNIDLFLIDHTLNVAHRMRPWGTRQADIRPTYLRQFAAICRPGGNMAITGVPVRYRKPFTAKELKIIGWETLKKEITIMARALLALENRMAFGDPFTPTSDDINSILANGVSAWFHENTTLIRNMCIGITQPVHRMSAHHLLVA